VDDLTTIAVPKGKKSGITNLQPFELMDTLGRPIEFRASGNKENMKMATIFQIASDARRLKVEPDSKGRAMDFMDVGDTLTKMSNKAEVRQPGDDLDKVRIFFLVNIKRYLVDVNIKKATHMHRSLNGANGIGHSWLYRGVERLLRHMRHGSGPESTWGCADISGKDTKFKAKDLLIQTMAALYYYESLDRPTTELAKWASHQAAFKTLRWSSREEAWAYVIGILASGELETGQGNTDHMGTTWEQFLDYTIRAHGFEDPLLLSAADDPFMVIVFQGDDMFYRIPKKYAQWISIRTFDVYLKAVMDMGIKVGSIIESDTPFTVLHPGTDEVQLLGPKFLKRHFVQRVVSIGGAMTPVVVPWRPTVDYHIRVYRATSDQSNVVNVISRIYGLLWDTMGTNRTAWDFLVGALRYLKNNDPHVQALAVRAAAGDEGLMAIGEDFLAQRMYKFALTPREMTAIFPFEHLLADEGPDIRKVRRAFLASHPPYDAQYAFRGTRPPSRTAIETVPTREVFPLVSPHCSEGDW
jgi:hypothetical protein